MGVRDIRTMYMMIMTTGYVYVHLCHLSRKINSAATHFILCKVQLAVRLYKRATTNFNY